MIRTENLTKNFDKTVALNNLSCSIPDGSIYGLVGSNGAGKSTFLRLITGIYRPTSGSIDYDGKAVFDNPEIKSRIAFSSTGVGVPLIIIALLPKSARSNPNRINCVRFSITVCFSL